MSVPPIVADVIARVSAETGVSVDKILGKSRKRPIVMARHAAMRLLASERPQWSSNQIWKAFGRSHTTVLLALGRLPNKLVEMRERAARIRNAP